MPFDECQKLAMLSSFFQMSKGVLQYNIVAEYGSFLIYRSKLVIFLTDAI